MADIMGLATTTELTAVTNTGDEKFRQIGENIQQNWLAYRQCEQENDWLISNILIAAYVTNGVPACPPKTTCYWEGYGPSPSTDDCAKCWRKAARKAVEENNDRK